MIPGCSEGCNRQSSSRVSALTNPGVCWIAPSIEKSVKKLADTSNSTWGGFTPIMPAFIRLIAGVVVLLVVDVVVLGLPGIQQTISGTQVSIAALIAFCIGLVVALFVLKFGTQLADTAASAYKAYKSWTPLLAFIFQIIAIGILYAVTNTLASPYMTSTPWAIPLVFLLIALIPTLRAVVTIVHAFESPSSTSRHTQHTTQE